ncbi:dipeptide epimerase [Cysteiniphilum halobium]|uniref:dipeptide epimerase n=1 Tax=Cysteiniphilum halobium TaxID=2219059 RepID=UPI000E646ACF|nr:dipeptide epimerase [Cysteiniphilum halobium]
MTIKIKDIQCHVSQIKLNRTFVTAVRSTDYINDLHVDLICDNGLIASGTAPATTLVIGETLTGMQAIIESYYKPILIGRTLEDLPEFIAMINRIVPFNSGAKMAIDTACYALLAKLSNQNIACYLGAKKTNNKLESCVTISCGEIQEVLSSVEIAINKGFKKLKIKLGTEINHDMEVTYQIQNHLKGKTISLLVDANQGWNYKETIQFIKYLEKMSIKIELLEQPVHARDISSMKKITYMSPFPIAADESVFNTDDALNLFTHDACDVINIKLAKCGGIHQAIRLKTLADCYHKSCMVGCMMESPLGISMAANVALALNIKLVDLDPIDWVNSNEYQSLLSYHTPYIEI